jgi:superfamily II DNA or RNA helicase
VVRVRAILKPRPYQREALDALTGKERELIVLPTGGGKTVVFAHLSAEFLAAHRDLRVIVVVHTDELVKQAYDKIRRVAPHLSIGILKGTRREVTADVVVASVQTLKGDKALQSLTCVGLIIIDEAHHVLAASYQKVLTYFGAFDDKVQVVGFTATPMRGDGKSLFPTFTRVAFQRDISWMIRKRYLKPPRGKTVRVPDLDLRKVKSTKADYREGELGEALAESLAPELVAKAWLEHAITTCPDCCKGPDDDPIAWCDCIPHEECAGPCRNRAHAAGHGHRKSLGFAPTVASAEVFAEAFRDAGIKCEVIHGGLPDGDEQNPEPGTRRRILADHREGLFPVLWNCMILTEGYDDPEVSCIVMARPTKSKGLYIQIVGRGLRVDEALPWEGQDCLLLDVVGSATLHGDLRCLADLSERPLKEEDARSGKTLVELEDEFDAGPGIAPDGPEWYAGPVEVHDFDPLGNATSKVWLKTKGGTYFVPSGKSAYVFICQYPAPGQWSVAWCTTGTMDRRYDCGEGEEGVPRPHCTCGNRCPGRPVGMTIHRGLPLDQAMVWAEDLAVDMGTDLNASNKRAPWRKRPASEKLVTLARGLGIKLTETRDAQSGMVLGVQERMGEVSDKVTVVLGSRRIDPLVARIRQR